MKKTDTLVRLMSRELEDKEVLEVACGTADFSISASRYARYITCIDVESKRLNSLVEELDNVNFRRMDASQMDFKKDTFDRIILYNALYHIRTQYDAVMAECRRVLKPEGSIILIAAWKLDISLMSEMFGQKLEWLDGNCIVRIGKGC